ncbi:hypothetical protein [Burkholderia pyrrocinia]|uniref:hypothetical protein n=1 Tax=Burkholderia pyrrocinia TaxID=60550 RepID=UPI001FC7C17C|nr:hypothetical protein [Burkholderia pyrrocinia]
MAGEAERSGLIATLTFPRALRVWDRGAPASSLLGICDQLTSPDYEWIQWFGARLHQAMRKRLGATSSIFARAWGMM